MNGVPKLGPLLKRSRLPELAREFGATRVLMVTDAGMVRLGVPGELRGLLEAAGLPVAIKLPARRRTALIQAMRLDKKVSGGRMRFVLARKIGRVESGREIPPEWICEALAPGGVSQT